MYVCMYTHTCTLTDVGLKAISSNQASSFLPLKIAVAKLVRTLDIVTLSISTTYVSNECIYVPWHL